MQNPFEIIEQRLSNIETLLLDIKHKSINLILNYKSMCFFMAQNQPITKVEKRFKANVDKPENFLQSEYIVGFEYLNVPIILESTPEIISTNFH